MRIIVLKIYPPSGVARPQAMQQGKDTVIMRTHILSGCANLLRKGRYMSVEEIREFGRRFVDEVLQRVS
jgi:hypothetical protein